MASPRRQTLAEKGLPPHGLARVSHLLPASACILSFLFSLLAFNLGSTLSPSWRLDPSSEDVDTTIKDVATDAAVEADKIAAEESARDAAEDSTKGPTEGSDKERAEEPGKGPTKGTDEATAEEAVVDDQPPPLPPLAPAST